MRLIPQHFRISLRRSRAPLVVLAGCALLGFACTTPTERVATGQRDDWLAGGGAREALLTLPENPGLADFERVTLQNSPALRAAYERWRSQVSAIAQARTLPDPRVDFGYFARAVETRVGPQQASFGFEQRIPWLSKLSLAGDSRALAAQSAFAEAEAVRLGVQLQVRTLWAELYFLARRTAITASNVELVRQWQPSARARYESSMLSYRDITRSQIELNTLEDELLRLTERRRPLQTRLLAVVGVDLNTEVALPTGLPENASLPPDDELLTRLRARNPELVALSRRVDGAEVDVDLARSRYRPDIQVGLSYILTGDARTPGVADSGQDAVIPRLGVSVPIWWGAYGEAVESASADRRAAREGLRGRRLALEADLADALFRLRDSERRLLLYRDEILPKARETLDSTMASYRTGRAPLIDLVDAQRTLLEFELAFARAEADKFVTDASVRALVGGS